MCFISKSDIKQNARLWKRNNIYIGIMELKEYISINRQK